MDFFKRAWCSVTRKKGKSLILFAVIFLLGNVIAGAIAIKQSTQNVEATIKKQLGSTATIEIDWENNQEDLMTNAKSPEALTVDTIKKVGESPYVKYYDYNVLSYFQTKELKPVSFESDQFGGFDTIALKGSNYSNILDVEEKKISLTTGSVFTQSDIEEGKNVGLISSKLAEENGLSVGDQMIIDLRGLDYMEDGTSKEIFKQDLPIEIIGIFEPSSLEVKEKEKGQKQDVQQQYMSVQQLNTIYLPNKVVLDATKAYNEQLSKESSYSESDTLEENSDYYVPIYVLKSPDDVQAFKEEIQPLLPTLYKVDTSSDQYERIGGSMKNMAKISGYVVVIAVIATLLIISLVVLLFMRDRKHELGIYLSLGDKRRHVMGQIIIEMLLISGLALVLSLLTGHLLGKMVSESLLNGNLLTNNLDQMGMMYYSNDVFTTNLTAEDVLNSYEVTFSIGYMISYLVVGLGTVLLSAILPLLYIVRLNPKKIMM